MWLWMHCLGVRDRSEIRGNLVVTRDRDRIVSIIARLMYDLDIHIFESIN